MAHVAHNYALTERLRLHGAEGFSDELGGFGETVPPRIGEIVRKHQDKEDYCLRRLLVAWHAVGQLTFPTVVRVATKPSGHEQVPDFVVSFGSDDVTIGVEVTEAGAATHQAQMTKDAKDVRSRLDNEAVVVSEGGEWIGDAAEVEASVDIIAAIDRKEEASRQGLYRGVAQCDLLVYDNTRSGLIADQKVTVDRVRQHFSGRSSSFRQIHLLGDRNIVLNLRGPEPDHIDLTTLYDADLAGWAAEQSRRAVSGGNQSLDLRNIAEELAHLGKSERRARDSHLRNLLAHLLKWRYQTNRQTKSWRLTIYNGRMGISDISKESPSLDLTNGRDVDKRTFDSIYSEARRMASVETGMPIDAFPEICPFTLKQVLDADFLPEH